MVEAETYGCVRFLERVGVGDIEQISAAVMTFVFHSAGQEDDISSREQGRA